MVDDTGQGLPSYV